MAPFSICSQCTARTRKVVKDPKTLKEIYLCPKCCKAKAEAPKQLVNVEDCKEAGKTRTQLAVVQPAEPPKLPVLPSPVKLPITPVETDRPLPPTPPLMQIVVINGRKYIAISATAPDN